MKLIKPDNVILRPSFIWAKNPALEPVFKISNPQKAGFFATLRMTDWEVFGVNE